MKSGYVKVFGVALTAGASAATFVAASHADGPTIRLPPGPVRGNVAADFVGRRRPPDRASLRVLDVMGLT